MDKAMQAFQAHKEIEAMDVIELPDGGKYRVTEEDKAAMRKGAGLPEPTDTEKELYIASNNYEKALDDFNTQWKLATGWKGKVLTKWNPHTKSFNPATEQETKEYKLEEANLKRLSERVSNLSGVLTGTDIKSQQKAKIASSVPPDIELMDIWKDLNDTAREQAIKMYFSGKSVSDIKKELLASSEKILKEKGK